jgi:RNA polymerase sigma factor (sigma-70 family)
MDRTSDADLVIQARSGDRSAFAALVKRHRAMAQRIANIMLRQPEAAREMANEAMLQAYLSLDRLRDPSRFQSWLHGIVLNVCRGHIRDQRRAPLSLEEIAGGLRFEAIPFTGIEPDPQEVAEALSPKNRAATLLFYYDQLSVREVAATLDISVAAVKTRLHASRVLLRERLLPAYEDYVRIAPHGQQEKKMVKVEIADVVTKEERNEETNETRTMHIVILLDEAGRRVLPIWVGPTEGRAIATAIEQIEFPRPMTVSFMARLLDAAGAEVEEVRIDRLHDDTFFAVAKIRRGDVTREVDARPSDALALAAHNGSPIFAAEDVFSQVGLKVPEEVKQARPEKKGIHMIASAIQEWMERSGGKPYSEAGAAAMLGHQEDLLAFLYGEKAGEAHAAEQ